MYWEVWTIPSSSMVASEATEADALRVVRELLATDWTADELVLILDDPALADEELTPGVTGDELARRAGLTGPDEIRRTA
jgi:hypothetical protein